MSESTDPQNLIEARRLVQATEKGLNERNVPAEVLRKHAADAIELLLPIYSNDVKTYRREFAAAYLLLGHTYRGTEQVEAQRQAAKHYDQAIALYDGLTTADFGDEEEINDHANAWTNRGIVFLNLPEKMDAEEALNSFEKAIEWRKDLKLEASDNFRWGLAAAYMNRADALTRMASEENLQKALASYDEAFVQLEALNPESHELYHNRLATAYMNRGMTAQALGNEAGQQQAILSYDKAIETLTNAGLGNQPVHQRTLAAANLNKGLIHFTPEPSSFEIAKACAEAAMKNVEGLDDKDLVSADISLRARHLICRIMAAEMEGQSVEALLKSEKVEQASDIVDDAMTLVRLWDSRGLPHFRPIAKEIFQFGSRLYIGCQPQFLAEFLLENLDPEANDQAIVNSPDLHKVASEGVWFAALELEKMLKSPEATQPERNAKLGQLLNELRATEQRLAALRERFLQPPAPNPPSGGTVTMTA